MKLLVNIFCLMAYLPNIKSDCELKYPRNSDIAPKFEKNIGKFKIRIPLRGNKELTYASIKLYDGETVQGFCETYFSPIMYESREEFVTYDYYRYEYSATRTRIETIINQTTIALNCRQTTLFYNDFELTDQTFSCMEQIYSIYSTKKPYSWCENKQNSSTFLIAAEMPVEKNILAAICFNMDNLSLQTLVYNATHLQRGYLHQPKDINTNNAISSEYLDENLSNFKTSIVSDLSEELLQEKLIEMAKTHKWLNLANYEVSLIVQDELLMKYFKDYENILNVIWWRNLRLGNWKCFQETLKNYASSHNYELYIGTSGVAQYPPDASDDKCSKEKYLEMKFGYGNETIPAYIWTYLKANDNLNKEFVMVGYNSPYAEYFTSQQIIFCPDICSQIPWLKTISSSFRYAYAGIMFCCSTDFIRQTNYLEGFPMELLMAPKTVTTVTITASKDFTTENYLDDLETFNADTKSLY